MKSIFILFMAAMPFVAHAGLYDDRAKEAADQQEREWQAIPTQILFKQNLKTMNRVNSFVRRHGGNTAKTTCSVGTVNCQFNGSSTGCFPASSPQDIPIAAIDPHPWNSVGACKFELGNGLACQADEYNLSADCYDANLRRHKIQL